jgi:hypothetical protein
MVRSAFTNGIVIGAVVLAIVYVAYNYDPSLGGLLGRRDGFEDAPAAADAAADATAAKTAAVAGAAATAKPTTATAKPTAATAKPAAATAKPATATMPTAGAVIPGATITATPGTAVGTQGFKSGGNSKKEGFADLASMEGPAAFASAEAPAGCYPRDQLTPIELLPADQNTIYAQQNPMGVGSLKGKNFLSAGALIGVNTVGQSLRNANLQLRSEPPNPQTPVSIFFQSTIGPDVSHRPLEVGA